MDNTHLLRCAQLLLKIRIESDILEESFLNENPLCSINVFGSPLPFDSIKFHNVQPCNRRTKKNLEESAFLIKRTVLPKKKKKTGPMANFDKRPLSNSQNPKTGSALLKLTYDIRIISDILYAQRGHVQSILQQKKSAQSTGILC